MEWHNPLSFCRLAINLMEMNRAAGGSCGCTFSLGARVQSAKWNLFCSRKYKAKLAHKRKPMFYSQHTHTYRNYVTKVFLCDFLMAQSIHFISFHSRLLICFWLKRDKRQKGWFRNWIPYCRLQFLVRSDSVCLMCGKTKWKNPTGLHFSRHRVYIGFFTQAKLLNALRQPEKCAAIHNFYALAGDTSARKLFPAARW
jgi:hypothetical protein